jgi:hypothetical protein
VRLQENVLAESSMMVPETRQRLEAALTDLQTYVVSAAVAVAAAAAAAAALGTSLWCQAFWASMQWNDSNTSVSCQVVCGLLGGKPNSHGLKPLYGLGPGQWGSCQELCKSV